MVIATQLATKNNFSLSGIKILLKDAFNIVLNDLYPIIIKIREEKSLYTVGDILILYIELQKKLKKDTSKLESMLAECS